MEYGKAYWKAETDSEEEDNAGKDDEDLSSDQEVELSSDQEVELIDLNHGEGDEDEKGEEGEVQAAGPSGAPMAEGGGEAESKGQDKEVTNGTTD